MANDHGVSGARVLGVVGHYPSPYKPYYDAQFADLLRTGYDLRIVAAPPLDRIVNDKVVTSGILERTAYYPESGRGFGAGVAARALRWPLRTARFLRSAPERNARRAAVDLLNMLGLPDRAPDAVLIHELGVALRFWRIRDWFPGVPLALYYHGGEVPSVRAYEADQVARAFRAFDIVFTNTAFAREQAISRGCPPASIVILPVGFDLNEYRPPEPRPYRRDGVLHLLSAGRMSEEKGLRHALDALSMVVRSGRRNILYSIAGEGYLRPELEKYVAEEGLHDHVRFLGALPAARLIAAMGEADALVLPSFALGTWAETQACAVQEAMLMRALAITTRTGGVPESVAPGMQCFSVPEKDAEALAGAISDIYDMPADQTAALGLHGRRFVEDAYDIRTLNRRMMTLLLA